MKRIVLISLLLATTVANAGIYRHDVPKSRYTELAVEPQFDCVAQLYWKNTWIGSCVLVGDRYILSAAHCFMEQLTEQDTIYQDGKTILVNQPYAEFVRDPEQYFVYFKGKKYQSKTVHIYPEYFKNNMSHNCDIALLELAEPVTNVTPATICRTFDELHADITGVGFGVHGIADEPENIDTIAEKIAGENTIDSFCGYKMNGRQVGMLCDFDHPTNIKYNRMGSNRPRALEYTTSGGDSGGGAFRKTSKGWELVGICGGNEHGGVDVRLLITKGVGYYGQIMEWQRVSAFAGWIDANER